LAAADAAAAGWTGRRRPPPTAIARESQHGQDLLVLLALSAELHLFPEILDVGKSTNCYVASLFGRFP
jgi:hypothetical protein